MKLFVPFSVISNFTKKNCKYVDEKFCVSKRVCVYICVCVCVCVSLYI